MRRLLLVVLIALSPFIVGFSLQIAPVTQYTDNTPITAPNLPVLYDVWQGSTRIANGSTLTSFPLSDNTFGLSAMYTVRTRLNDGRVSDNAVVSLVSPNDLRIPKAPAAGWSIIP